VESLAEDYGRKIETRHSIYNSIKEAKRVPVEKVLSGGYSAISGSTSIFFLDPSTGSREFEISLPIQDYFLPKRNTNETATIKDDDMSDYIALLERDNRDLSQRVAELENQFTSINRYIPTIVRMLEEYETAEMRIEKKKQSLREKYTLKVQAPLQLWTGADQEFDIADTSLDEMLANMDE
jgi:hypothetical protein